MKILNFGSMNIDRVYDVDAFVRPGETILARELCFYPGGKGLNQSVAAARAGAQVIHAGAIGEDGAFLADLLREAGADVAGLLQVEGPSGHAVIQVSKSGQNSIIVFGGANQQLPDDYLDAMLAQAAPGDIVLLQNETNATGAIMRRAHDRGLVVAFNPSPFPDDLEALPLACVDLFLVNASEGALLANLSEKADPETVLLALEKRYPNAAVVLTLGSDGVVYRGHGQTCAHPGYRVNAVDTTAAGDTFCGYFLAGLCRGENIDLCLMQAGAAAAIAVSRAGAAPSIPEKAEMEAFLASR
ncbi:MAG: ribokinase [Eubacteriales bacterium]|nr:ribokinase [Eubacteriales bacterium]